MRDINPLTPNPMRVSPATMSRIKSLMNLCEVVEGGPGMKPTEFESYCELAGIRIEPLVVSPTNLNEGIYHITLPDYGYRCAYSLNGSPIEISGNPLRDNEL
jgi:hypothetical protein